VSRTKEGGKPVVSSSSPTEARQDAPAAAANAEYFADNGRYKQTQRILELYRFIALAASHETEHTRTLLDIGNGGLFGYPIAHIPRIVAVDIFVEKDFVDRYPGVEWRQMSALDMAFSERFDTVIAINTLHHIVGTTVKGTYANLGRLMERAEACLDENGKVVIIESTMPRWFVRLYGLLFVPMLKVWPLTHPPTFQFYFRDIIRAAEQAGLVLREITFIPKTSDFMFLGWQIKRWMAPIRVGKFVFARRGTGVNAQD
jgi:cyclopropane fatty-acyl-phospholipid synthase-like methyltransferase